MPLDQWRPEGHKQLREVIHDLASRSGMTDLIGDTAGTRLDEITDHLMGVDPPDDFDTVKDDSPFKQMDHWVNLARAGDPTFRSDLMEPKHREGLDRMRSGFKDLSEWQGPGWRPEDKEEWRKQNGRSGFLGALLGTEPGRNDLSPGDYQARQWSRGRHFLEGLARKPNPNAVQHYSDVRALAAQYDRGSDSQKSWNPLSWTHDPRSLNHWGMANYAEDAGLDAHFNGNENPLSYANNHYWSPIQRAVYDTAMEHPQEWPRDPTPEEIEQHGLSGEAVNSAKTVNAIARPFIGFAKNLPALPGHLADSLDIHWRGNQVNQPSPDLPSLHGLRGMEAQGELNRIRDTISRAKDSMPVRAYHHRNTGEHMTDLGAMASTISSDVFTDPSFLYTPFLPGFKYGGELMEEAVTGGPMNLFGQYLSGFPTKHKTEDQSANWWSNAHKDRAEGERIVKENNLNSGGILGGLLPNTNILESMKQVPTHARRLPPH